MDILFQSFNVFRVVPAEHHDNHKTTLSYYTVSCVLPVYSRQTGADHLLPLFFAGTSHRSTMWRFQIFVSANCVRLFRSQLTQPHPLALSIITLEIIDLALFLKTAARCHPLNYCKHFILDTFAILQKTKYKHQTLINQSCNIMVKLHTNKCTHGVC